MKKTVLYLLFMLAMFPGPALPTGDEEIVIIVSPENRRNKILDAELKSIYLGEKKEWEDGKGIIPVDLDEADPLREKFDITYLNKSLSSLKYYWVQQIFTGRGVPPLELKNEQLVKEYVASHPGSIAYIHARNLDATIRKVQITGDR
ncbi:MAG: phosphate ABC transporter substrate-binding protein [Nitrospirae bacterium]|nr:phosphate ABC transporter substrate-binding protein [Nitrospirota bacterium]MBI3594695.1 phosphate ABC transporter substrate-binding protein [Nitrospirota bacterium]